MSLLDKIKAMKAARIIKFEVPGDAAEGKITHIKKFSGKKFESIDYFLETDSGETVIVRANSDTVLARCIADEDPAFGDRMAVMYNGQPEGKRYKSWTVLVEYADGREPLKVLTKDRKKEREPVASDGAPSDNMPSDDDIPF
jgi:hypothetical protein